MRIGIQQEQFGAWVIDTVGIAGPAPALVFKFGSIPGGQRIRILLMTGRKSGLSKEVVEEGCNPLKGRMRLLS